jgi:L-ornithine N5-oxygenase
MKTDNCSVNEIFDPERVSDLYNAPSSARQARIALDRGTNYGVVRLTLLEHLYEKQYMQRLREPDESKWRCRINSNRVVICASQSENSSVKLKFREVDEISLQKNCKDEELDVDYVFTATGYARNSHEEMLDGIRDLLQNDEMPGRFPVGRNYGVKFDKTKVASEEAGIWLQGCNESTHGLSDTLLSILAVRGGELIESIFGREAFHDSETTNYTSKTLS